MKTDMRQFNIVYVIWAVAAAFPLIAAVIFRAFRRASMGKFAKGFAAGFMTYGGIFLVAAILVKLLLPLIFVMVIIPMLAVTLLVIPLFALILVFAAVMIYYHALFKKIQSSADALSVSLGLFSISFLAGIACECFKIYGMHSFLTASEVLGSYKMSMSGMILSMIIDAVIKTGLSAGAVIAVRCMYSSEKMTKRGAAMASSAITGILTAGFDMLLFV